MIAGLCAAEQDRHALGSQTSHHHQSPLALPLRQGLHHVSFAAAPKPTTPLDPRTPPSSVLRRGSILSAGCSNGSLRSKRAAAVSAAQAASSKPRDAASEDDTHSADLKLQGADVRRHNTTPTDIHLFSFFSPSSRPPPLSLTSPSVNRHEPASGRSTRRTRGYSAVAEA